MYKYQDAEGRWVFTDREPSHGQDYERQARPTAAEGEPEIRLRQTETTSQVILAAENTCHCPVELGLRFTKLDNAVSSAGAQLRQVVPARQVVQVTRLQPVEPNSPWSYDYEYGYILGDPQSRHQPARAYRPPFGAAREYRVSQAYPESITHTTPDSHHAVDIAMPEQNAVHAARGGVVVAVAHSNFRGGVDPDKFAAAANVIRILHDDGTFGLYAHLSWDSIRVRPGQRVKRGEYVANSGNTGFTTGPHLHFAVLRNEGLRTISVPVRFDDGQGNGIMSRSGAILRNP